MQISSQVSLISLLILAVGASPSYGQQKKNAFDSSKLIRKEEIKPLTSDKESAKKNKLQVDLTVKEDPQKLEVQLKAINLIIKTEKDRAKKIGLYLRKSYLHVSAAKMLGMNRTSKGAMSDREKFHLAESRKILTFLLKNKNNDKKSLATIYNVLGLVEYESDRLDKAVESFLQSINYDPKSSQAETMSMFIAEYYFDHDKYELALKYYNLLYAQMTPYQKALADYKSAWCWINLKDFEKTEALFVKVIQNNADKSITEDSYKDLAFIVTQKNNEFYSITKSKELFVKKELRAKFLYYNLLFFLQQSKNNPRERLFQELFATQEDEYEKTKIYILKVAFEKRDYPTTAVYKAVMDVDRHMKTLTQVQIQKFASFDAYQFEQDNEIIIRQFVDAYAGRLKTTETFTKDQLAKMMVDLISVQLKWFPQSKNFLTFYNLWVDSCVDSKNSKCLLDLEKDLQGRLAERKEMKDALRVVQIEILSLYDEAAQKDPATHEAAFYFRLKEFEKTYPQDEQILKIEKKILSIDFKNKSYVEALRRAEVIYKAEKNAANLEKVLLTLFELKQYQAIASHSDIELYKTKEINDIRREVSLKLAQEKSAQGEFAEYQKNIKSYLSTQPPFEKAVVVQVDYLSQVLKGNQFDLFQSEWKALDPKIQTRKEMQNVISLAYDRTLTTGQFFKLDAMMNYQGNEELHFQTLLYRMSWRKPWVAEDQKVFDGLPAARKTYIYNIQAITHPDTTLARLMTKKSKTELEHKIAKLALYMTKKTDQFQLTQAEMKLYKDYVPAQNWYDQPAAIEKDFQKMEFPSKKLKDEAYANAIEKKVKEIKKLRQKSLQALPQLTRTQKLRVLQKLIENEEKMAEVITSSPLPTGLTEAQVQEYNTGLAQFASEYTNQALEFKKAKSEMEGQVLNETESALRDQLPEIKTTSWDLPSGEVKDKALKIFSQVSPEASLIYIDHQLENKALATEDHARLRAGLLLRIENSVFMRRFIYEEFKLSQQQGLIEKWKNLK